jgi:tight adherence protein C
MLALLTGIMAATSVMLIFLGLVRPRRSAEVLAERLGSFAARTPRSLEELELERPFSERVVQPLVEYIARLLRSLTPQRTLDNMARDLILAGSPRNMTPMYFLGLKGLGAVLGGGTALMLATLLKQPAWLVPTIAAGAFIGYKFPNLWLHDQIKKRQKAIQRALPDALDLLTISVEAGLGFDLAMQRLVDKSDTELAREFARVLQEMRVGVPRRDALRNMLERTAVDDLGTFISALIQADTLGVPIARVLRVQSQQMRVVRRQRAETEARKAPIKMLFPLVFLIFPPLYMIMMGPAALQAFRFFVR